MSKKRNLRPISPDPVTWPMEAAEIWGEGGGGVKGQNKWLALLKASLVPPSGATN